MAQKETDELKEEVSPVEDVRSYHERCHVGFVSYEEINERNKETLEEIKRYNTMLYGTSKEVPDSKLSLVLGPDK